MPDREEVLRLAREAGFDVGTGYQGRRLAGVEQTEITDELDRFAALVAEICAKVCDDGANDWHGHDGKYACEDRASVIRSRFVCGPNKRS